MTTWLHVPQRPRRFSWWFLLLVPEFLWDGDSSAWGLSFKHYTGMTEILQVQHGFLDHRDQRLRNCVEWLWCSRNEGSEWVWDPRRMPRLVFCTWVLVMEWLGRHNLFLWATHPRRGRPWSDLLTHFPRHKLWRFLDLQLQWLFHSHWFQLCPGSRVGLQFPQCPCHQEHERLWLQDHKF